MHEEEAQVRIQSSVICLKASEEGSKRKRAEGAAHMNEWQVAGTPRYDTPNPVFRCNNTHAVAYRWALVCGLAQAGCCRPP
jgi:hypothetical protein